MNQDTPKISVIVAAFNQERFIGRCLRSLLNQSIPHEHYEIIVINDGSSDLTRYALELFCDPKNSVVRVITNETNLGLPASLNKGIAVARAPYLVRVDADDFVNKNFLNFLHYYLETNPKADAVACDYLLVNDAENVIERSDCIASPIACGIMFRKDQIIEIGLYDEDFRYQEDRDFRIRFDKKYIVSQLAIPLYRYRRHHNNITNDVLEMDRFKRQLLIKHGIQEKD